MAVYNKVLPQLASGPSYTGYTTALRTVFQEMYGGDKHASGAAATAHAVYLKAAAETQLAANAEMSIAKRLEKKIPGISAWCNPPPPPSGGSSHK